MNLRRTTSLLAAAALVFAVAACGDSDGSSEPGEQATDAVEPGEPSEPSDGGAGPLDGADLTFTGPTEPGTDPEVTFPTPLASDYTFALVLEEGDGEILQPGQSASVHYVLLLGDGTRLGSTWVDGGGAPEEMVVGGTGLELLDAVLENHRVGSRIFAAGPAMGVEPTDDGSTTWVIFAEIVSAREILERAEGSPVTPAPGLPTVTLDAASGEPTLGEVPAAYRSVDEMTVQVLIEGTGPEVLPGQTVTIHYTGWTPDGEVFDSSWGRGPATFPLPNLILGWQEGIPGHPVGSQVMLIIPPALAYGESGHQLAGQTLIFVIDILDAS
ncbi:MAG: FKBP-type peptidyl-prolyl cis-trans isomerase [Promicromonosporaceae bacterium]|nr:FKBP-type peptidyl-prolyl cis-trans isomerase [Promicromonosporaceae bacterium]